jgi:hypothetical protein
MADDLNEKKPDADAPASDKENKDEKPADKPASDSDPKTEDKASDKPEEKKPDAEPTADKTDEQKPEEAEAPAEPTSPDVETTNEVPSTDAENPAEEKTDEQKKEEALQPLASEVQAKEEQVANLELVYDKLQKAKEEIQSTGAISQETMVSMETMFPGIMTDSYPNGGYNASNLHLAIEEINFKQTLMMGGIITAIIGVILGLLRLLGVSFGNSASSGTTSSQKAKENSEKSVEVVKEIKETNKVIDDVAREIGHGKDIPPDDMKKFVDFVNEITGATFSYSEGFDNIVRKAGDNIERMTIDMLSGLQSVCAIESYKYPQNVSAGGGSKETENIVRLYIEYNKQLPNVISDISQEFADVLKKDAAPNDLRTGAYPTIPTYTSKAPIDKVNSYIRNVYSGTVIEFMQWRITAAARARHIHPVTIRNLDDVVVWQKHIADHIDQLRVKVDGATMHKLKEMEDKAAGLLKTAERNANDPNLNSSDKAYNTTLVAYLKGVLHDMRAIGSINSSNNRMIESLEKFGTVCLTQLTKHKHLQLRILTNAAYMFKDNPETKKRVQEHMDKLTGQSS